MCVYVCMCVGCLRVCVYAFVCRYVCACVCVCVRGHKMVCSSESNTYGQGHACSGALFSSRVSGHICVFQVRIHLNMCTVPGVWISLCSHHTLCVCVGPYVSLCVCVCGFANAKSWTESITCMVHPLVSRVEFFLPNNQLYWAVMHFANEKTPIAYCVYVFRR